MIVEIREAADVPPAASVDDIHIYYYMPQKVLDCYNIFCYTKEYGKNNKQLTVPKWIDEVITYGANLPNTTRLPDNYKINDLTLIVNGRANKNDDNKNKEHKSPKLKDKVKNFTKAVVKHVANGMKEVPESVLKQRLSACEECPLLNKDRTCSLCGCPVDTKTKWASEQCPADPPKWLRHDEKKVSQISGNSAQPSKKAGCVPCSKKRRRNR